MNTRRFILGLSLSASIFILCGLVVINLLVPPISLARELKTRDYKELIEEVWQIIKREYLVIKPKLSEWEKIKEEYLNRSYHSKEEVYTAIEEMLKRIGDSDNKFTSASLVTNSIDTQGISSNEQNDAIKNETFIVGIRNTGFGKIGYISVSQFNFITTVTMKNYIESQLKENVVGFVLDLRDNTGGLIYEVFSTARLWLNNCIITNTIDNRGDIEQIVAKQQAITDKPLVVLIDGTTAAGAEILASALKDNKRAVLVGSSSLGKNTIQSVIPLSDDSQLTVTIAKWTTPNGLDISNKGLAPNVEVTLTKKQKEALARLKQKGTSSDLQYVKALEVLKSLTKK